MSDKVKIVVVAPKSHEDKVRKAIGEAGAGVIGKYDFNSFTISGTGRWRSLKGSNPYDGEVGKFSKTEEERIEFLCDRKIAKKVIAEIRKVHPYEEVAIDIYPLISEEEL